MVPSARLVGGLGVQPPSGASQPLPRVFIEFDLTGLIKNGQKYIAAPPPLVLPHIKH